MFNRRKSATAAGRLLSGDRPGISRTRISIAIIASDYRDNHDIYCKTLSAEKLSCTMVECAARIFHSTH